MGLYVNQGGEGGKPGRVPPVVGIPSGFALKNDPLHGGIWFNVGEGGKVVARHW